MDEPYAVLSEAFDQSHHVGRYLPAITAAIAAPRGATARQRPDVATGPHDRDAAADDGSTEPTDANLSELLDVCANIEQHAVRLAEQLRILTHSHAHAADSLAAQHFAVKYAGAADAHYAALNSLLRALAAWSARLHSATHTTLIWDAIAQTLAAEEAAAAADPLGTAHAVLQRQRRVQGDPFEFHRLFAPAVARRRADVATRARYLARKHRLYPRVPAMRVVTESKVDMLNGTVQREVALQPLPGEAALPGAAGTCVDVCFCVRTDVTREACVERGIPFELELIRAPIAALLDPIATSASTTHAWDGAMLLEATLAEQRLHTRTHAAEELGVVEEGKFDAEPTDPLEAAISALELAHGPSRSLGAAAPPPGAVMPIPSARGPRVRRVDSHALMADFHAHSDLILSPYFADACGVHEFVDAAESAASADSRNDAAIVAVQAARLGSATMHILYEYIPDIVPLPQVLHAGGRLPESSPLFRHWLSELAHALRDIENQCTLQLPVGPDALSLANLYVSDNGSRLLVRDVQWGPPLPEDPKLFRNALTRRRRQLIRFFGSTVAALLCASRDDPRGVVSMEGDDELPDPQPFGPSKRREVSAAHAELGIAVALGEVFDLLLTDADGPDTVWTSNVQSPSRSTDSSDAASPPCVHIVSHAFEVAADDDISDVATPRSPVGTRSVGGRSISSRRSGSAGALRSAPHSSTRKIRRVTCKAVAAGACTLWFTCAVPGDSRAPPGARTLQYMCPITVLPIETSDTLRALLDVCLPSLDRHPVHRALAFVADALVAVGQPSSAIAARMRELSYADAVPQLAQHLLRQLLSHEQRRAAAAESIERELAMPSWGAELSQLAGRMFTGHVPSDAFFAEGEVPTGFRVAISMNEVAAHPYLTSSHTLVPAVMEAFLSYAYPLVGSAHAH